MVIQRGGKKKKKKKWMLTSFQEPKLADSEIAGKYAKVCPLKLNFAKSLCNFTEGLG